MRLLAAKLDRRLLAVCREQARSSSSTAACTAAPRWSWSTHMSRFRLQPRWSPRPSSPASTRGHYGTHVVAQIPSIADGTTLAITHVLPCSPE